jgi:hypothetical protein
MKIGYWRTAEEMLAIAATVECEMHPKILHVQYLRSWLDFCSNVLLGARSISPCTVLALWIYDTLTEPSSSHLVWAWMKMETT